MRATTHGDCQLLKGWWHKGRTHLAAHDTPPKQERVLHAIHIRLFDQHLVECADGREKDEGINVIEEWRPGLTLISSSADIVDEPVYAFFMAWKGQKNEHDTLIGTMLIRSPFSNVKRCSMTPKVLRRARRTSSAVQGLLGKPLAYEG